MPPTVIIPAHNEETTIGRNLPVLIDSLSPSIAVIVVCNGCSDRTAAVARAVSDRIEVHELGIASKTAAINHGESSAAPGPRLYLDADVSMSGMDASALIEIVSQPGVLFAEPTPVFAIVGSTFAVRAFYDVWLALHGRMPGDIGGGAFAISTEGRERFASFPEIVADDAYAHAHFLVEETVMSDVRSEVQAPKTAADLIRIKARSRFGTMQLAREFPQLWAGKRGDTQSLATKAQQLPLRLWLKVPAYAMIQIAARMKARRMLHYDSFVWERDLSSRSDV